MYAYIKGVVTEVNPGYITVEANGVGYLIICPNPYLYHVDDILTVYTHHYVREDINNLYGFRSNESKRLFIRLIQVSGIGPKSALSILATDAIDEIIQAIENSDVKFLTKFPGIGTKSAQQIILDLKGKLVEVDDELLPTNRSDVELALQSLGYNAKEISRIIKKVDLDQSTEDIIKEAFKLLLK